MAGAGVELQVGDRTVRISSPDRVYFPARGETKLDLAHYYLSVGDGIVRALRERPCMMHRFPAGVAGEKGHQKRVPNRAPAGCFPPGGHRLCPHLEGPRGIPAGEAPAGRTPSGRTNGASTWTRCQTA